MMILTSYISKAQDTLISGLTQDQLISLMQDYSKIHCKWDETYSGDRFMGYVKTVEVFFKDTAKATSIFFSSNTIKDIKTKSQEKLEIVYGDVDGESITFITEVEDPHTVVKTKRINFPRLEAEMLIILKAAKPGANKISTESKKKTKKIKIKKTKSKKKT